MIRLRKPDGSVPRSVPRLPPKAIIGDPPVYLATLRALVGRDPTFMSDQRIAQPDRWPVLDEVLRRASGKGAA